MPIIIVVNNGDLNIPVGGGAIRWPVLVTFDLLTNTHVKKKKHDDMKMWIARKYKTIKTTTKKQTNDTIPYLPL